MVNPSDIRDWLFRGLMFEADAEQFRSAGIRVGADYRAAEQALLEETIAPFAVVVRNECLIMMRVYALLFCFERSVRALISERLMEKHGIDWWEAEGVVPAKVQSYAKRMQEEAAKNSWLEAAAVKPIEYTLLAILPT